MDFSGFYGVSLRVFGEARQTEARRIRIVLGTAGGSHLPKLIFDWNKTPLNGKCSKNTFQYTRSIYVICPDPRAVLRIKREEIKRMNKNIVIGVLACAVIVLAGVIVNMKRANDLRNYAIQNDCTWTYQGTMYGDDRDYICK